MFQRLNIAGVPVDAVTYEKALAFLEQAIKDQKKIFVTTPNPEIIVLASQNPDYTMALQKADLAVPDGAGLIWASHYLATPAWRWGRWIQFLKSLLMFFLRPSRTRTLLPERVTGTDLFYKIIGRSEDHGWRIFLLGARPGIAEAAIDHLKKQYPQGHFVGCYAGSPDPAEAPGILQKIQSSQPDLLFVAYGNPAQELWIARYLKDLPSVKLAMGVGGAFDFAAGRVRRAPSWLQKMGLEWLWRLIREPRRLKRIWRATATFARLIGAEKKNGKTVGP